MPLRADIAPVLEPPQPLEPLPPTLPPASPYVSWTPAGGPELILSVTARQGIHLGGVDTPGSIIGLDMPPEEQFDTEIAGGDGQFMNSRRYGARPFALLVVIHADTLDELEQYRRQLIGSFNPARGEGVFTIAYPSGDRRFLNARYQSGLDIAQQGRMGGGLYFDSYTITLKARDPFPYGDEQLIKFTPPVAGEFFPLPFTISSSTTTGDSTVLIDGDEKVETWPTARLHGPMSTAVLGNRDTGRTLNLTPNLTAGQVLTVRMDPRTLPLQRFTRETGASVWVSVAGQFPVMWSLRPGSNDVTVMAAGTSATSLIELLYRPRFLSA